jgi:hypothetical protein
MTINFRSTWHFLRFFPQYIRAAISFPGYRPQPITVESFYRWINQFDEKDIKDVLRLLGHIIYISEKQTEDILVRLNNELIKQLLAKNISKRHIIYVQMHDPGSSSPLMLNILRDRGRLDQSGCRFIDWKDILGFSRVTSDLEQGAIIYVDDFSGSGHQFSEVRDYIAQYIVGTFAEFFLLPAICEESLGELAKIGVEPITHFKHLKTERPLHPDSTIFDIDKKDRLINICRQINENGALGYQGLATMVVFYRNSPDTIPAVFRGRVRQTKWVGIFPRITDLP